MGAATVLLAQCAPAAQACDLPRTLPWYFGAAIGLAWVATVAGVVLLLRRRLAARREQREARRPRRKAITAEKGSDVEPW